MIIEFFGPPGAGKTTLARALFCELRQQGYATEMALRYEPDRASILDPGGFRYALGRIARAIVDVIAMALHPIEHKDTFRVVWALLLTLPPRNPIWFVRVSQYLLRLSEIRRRSSNVDPIIIFDQGFIQAVCSLAVFSRRFDEKLFRRALTLIPKPDIAIHVTVDPSVQKMRLLARRRSEPPMARLFEAADNTNLQFSPVVSSVSALLRHYRRSAVVVELEQLSSVDAVINAIAETRASIPRQPIAVGSEGSDRAHVCEPSMGCKDNIQTIQTAAPLAPDSIPQGQPTTYESAGNQVEGFARASIWALTTYVLGAGLTSGAQFLIARLLHAGGYGIYSYVWAWVSLLSYGATLGLIAFVLRFTSAYQASGQWSLMYGSIRFAVSRALAAAIMASGTGLFIVWSRRHQLEPTVAVSLAIGFAIIPLMTMLLISAGLLRVFGGFIVAILPERVFRDGFLLAMVGAVAWRKLWPLDPTTVLLITFIGTAVALAFTVYAAVSLWPEQIRRVGPKYLPHEWWSFALPAMIMMSLEIVMARTGVLTLGWTGRIADAGVFALAFNVAMLVQLSRAAVSTSFSPNASATHERGDLSGLRSLFARASVFSLGGGAILALPVLIFTGPILRLFGQDFAEHVHVAQILVIGQLFAAAAGPQQNLLTMTGHERSAAAIMLVFFALTIVGCAMAGAEYGATGAAVVTSGALVAWNLTMAIHIKLRLGLEPGLMLALNRYWVRSGSISQATAKARLSA